MMRQRRGEVGGLLFSYIRYMLRWVFFVGISAFVIDVTAQGDSTDSRLPPWFELTGGLYSPAGLVGIGIGLPYGPRFSGSMAAGFGMAEGKHFSLGAEFRIATYRFIDARTFGYWSYTTGRQATDGYRTTDGQMLKFGVAFVLSDDVGTQLVARVGYASFTDVPYRTDTNGGHFNTYDQSGPLEGGLLLGIGVRFPLVASREGY